MRAGLDSILQGLNSVRRQGYGYIWANLAFVALCFPIVTAPAALRALFYVGYSAQTRSYSADIGDFWDEFRGSIWRTLPWGLAHALFALINFSNLVAYIHAEGIGYALLRGFWWLAGGVWLAVLLYTWALYYEMETPSLWGATRNAVVMIMLNPVFTLTILTFVVLLSLVSTVFLVSWMLLTFSAVASVGNAAVLNRLAVVREAT